MNILITGLGCPGTKGTIYALRHNPEKKKVKICGIDRNKEIAGKKLVDSFCNVPFATDSHYLHVLEGICSINETNIIIPQTTAEIEILSLQKTYFEENYDIHILTNDYFNTRRANSKKEVIEACVRAGLPVIPEYIEVQNISELKNALYMLGCPQKTLVVKPDRSNGSRGLRIIREPSIKDFFTEKGVSSISGYEIIKTLNCLWTIPLLVMEYLPGEEYSVDCFRSEDFEIAIPRIRKVIKDGISWITEVIDYPELSEYSLRLMKELCLTGVAGFQFKKDKCGNLKILECNPRIQGTMIASILAGQNLIWYAVENAIYGEVKSKSTSYKKVLFERYWGGTCEGIDI